MKEFCLPEADTYMNRGIDIKQPAAADISTWKFCIDDLAGLRQQAFTYWDKSHLSLHGRGLRPALVGIYVLKLSLKPENDYKLSTCGSRHSCFLCGGAFRRTGSLPTCISRRFRACHANMISYLQYAIEFANIVTVVHAFSPLLFSVPASPIFDVNRQQILTY